MIFNLVLVQRKEWSFQFYSPTCSYTYEIEKDKFGTKIVARLPSGGYSHPSINVTELIREELSKPAWGGLLYFAGTS